MSGNKAFVDAEVKRITGLKKKSAKLIHYRATQRQLLSIERRKRTEKWIGFVVTVVTTIACFVVGNIFALKKKHPYAYAWYSGTKVNGAQPGPGRDGKTTAYGYMRGPKPLGTTHYKIWCCAVSEEYHPLLSVLSLLGMCPTLDRAGAIFLLTFAQRYYNQIEGIHWSGNQKQLNYANAKSFVMSWANWDVSDNPWRWLYPQEIDFVLSIAVKNAQLEWETSYLASLFSGGLCQLVLDQTSSTSDADTMMQHLLGIKLVLFRNCEDERLYKAMQNATYASMATGSAIALYNMTRSAVSRVQYRIAELKATDGGGRYFKLGNSEFGPKIGPEGEADAEDIAKFNKMKFDKLPRARLTNLKMEWKGRMPRIRAMKMSELNERMQSDAFNNTTDDMRAQISESDLTGWGDEEATTTADAAAEESGELGAEVGAEATTEAADGIATAGAVAGEAAGDAAAAGSAAAVGATSEVAADAACGACMIGTPLLCLLCGAIAAAIATTVIMAVVTVGVCAAVGAATGAITFATSKCHGGVYYILVKGKAIPWTGDISVLPAGARHERMPAHGPGS